MQANRSEVLFVDYIAEHLNPSGRAGVIVPEGIIFQSNNAYKALRKMLVDGNYLVAVISLPAGIFQPYSGVKTSVLLMDKDLAKRTDKVLFVNVKADGYDLGAQRREIERNDLPEALRMVKAFQEYPTQEPANPLMAQAVSKSRLREDRDYNLSMERYRTAKVVNQKWPMVRLGDVISTVTPPEKLQKEDYFFTGRYPIIDQSQSYIAGSTDNESAVIDFENPLIIFGDHTCVIKYVDFPFAQGADGIKILNSSEEFIPKFLYYLLKYKGIEPEGYKRHFTKLKELQIPKPPLEVQQAIVSEIDGYQKIIEGARQVVENYKPVIKIDPSWPLVKLGEVCEVNQKLIDPTLVYGDKEFIYVDISSVENGTGKVSFEQKIVGHNAPSRAKRIAQKGDILLSTVRPNLKAFAYLSTVPGSLVVSTGFAVLSAKEKIMDKFFYYLLFTDYLQNQMINRMGRGSYPSINQNDVKELMVPLPPLNLQQSIAGEIDEILNALKQNRMLIDFFLKKIEGCINSLYH